MKKVLKTVQIKAAVLFLVISILPTLALATFGSNGRGSVSPFSMSVGFQDHEKLAPAITFVRQAKKSIDIEVYQMEDTEFMKAIRQALKNRIQVRIIKDPTALGETCKVFSPKQPIDTPECLDRKQLVVDVRNAGGMFVPYNKAAFCRTVVLNRVDIPSTPAPVATTACYEHGKMIIIDRGTSNQAALLSTGNFNSTSLCTKGAKPSRCNRDYSYVTDRADQLALLKTVFEKDLAGISYDLHSLLNKYKGSDITVSPYSLSPLLEFIGSARKTIQLQNQYLKEPTINAALIQAAKRGVEVEVMVSSFCAFGRPTKNEADKATLTFQAFEDAGIKTRIFSKGILVNGIAGYLHSKSIVVDGDRAWVGSVNGSTTAVSKNREFGIFFEDASSVSALSRIMSSDFKNPNGESWEESIECAKDYSSNITKNQIRLKKPNVGIRVIK